MQFNECLEGMMSAHDIKAIDIHKRTGLKKPSDPVSAKKILLEEVLKILFQGKQMLVLRRKCHDLLKIILGFAIFLFVEINRIETVQGIFVARV